jgi:membrane associated rhomboid family serine protease
MFVLPINRDRRPASTPWVTWTLIVVNSATWIGLSFSGLNAQAIHQYGMRPAHWTLQTLFTHMFLHAGLLHVAGNMWFLWMFAPKLEERLGQAWFLLAYFVCGVGAAGLHTLFSPGSTIPMVGASGAISGVAGMYFLLFPRSPFELVLYFGWWIRKSFKAQTRGAVGTWIGEQFVLGVITSSLRSSAIAFWAHVGGFVTGLIVAGCVVSMGSSEERQAVLHPQPLTEEEKDEIFADHVEQKSDLVSLKLDS